MFVYPYISLELLILFQELVWVESWFWDKRYAKNLFFLKQVLLILDSNKLN